jgi:subtilisin-like proprotein convertase family protein
MTRALVVAGLLLFHSVATADTLTATRDQPMFEAAHTVDIKIANGVATYTVRRMFSNPGTVADQVELELGLPYGAAATGLRIKAGERWYDGVLMEREAAAALYREMTGFGQHAPKDPALLAWMWADKLSLQMFPVMPGTVSTVEYTLTAPTRYEGGRYFVSYPRTATPEPSAGARLLTLAMPVVTVHPAWGDGRTAILIDGKRVGRGTPIVLLPPVRQPWEDQVDASPDASYVSSTIEIAPESRTEQTYATATVTLELPHTYKSDLRVDLLTPNGERIAVHEGAGGGANDLRGAFPVKLPARTQAAGTWRLVVSDHAALDTGTLDRWSIAFGSGKEATTKQSTDTPLFVPDAPESASEAGVATIAIDPPAFTTWLTRLGKVTASDKHVFGRLEIDVAPQLVPTPKKAQVVFVLDTSYSIGEDGVAAQLDLMRAYLTHLPDAEIEIVTYRRRALRAFGRFVPAADFSDALAVAKARGTFALGNGSALDEGARLAAAALADRKGPRRIVLATDELWRTTLTPVLAQAAFAKLSAETVVHVIVPQIDHDDRPALERHDDAAFAPLATRHHGIYVHVQGFPAETIKALVPTALELVRPTRIEFLSAPGFELESPTLHEGAGVRLMFDKTAAPTTVTLTGKLWSDPVRKVVSVTTPFSMQTAAFVFGADAHQGLTEAEMMKVAMFGRAVSPVTSYVAAEPGVRPSTIGLETGSYGTIGHGMGGGAGYGSGWARRPPNFRSLVDTASCVASVRPTAAWNVMLSVETTRDEVTDVALDKPSPMATCLAEFVWALRLDKQTFVLDREQFQVELSGPAAP